MAMNFVWDAHETKVCMQTNIIQVSQCSRVEQSKGQNLLE